MSNLHLVKEIDVKPKKEHSQTEKNIALMLTFAGAKEESNSLHFSDTRIAYSRAIEAQQYAKLTVDRMKANRTAKQATIEQIRDLESIRKEDEREKRIIRADTGLVRSPKETLLFRGSASEGRPELSDARKLVYNAAKAIERENK